jgi:hypothetical protein
VRFSWTAFAIKDAKIFESVIEGLDFTPPTPEPEPETTPEEEPIPEEAVIGCTDENATNYNATATEDDGSCVIEEPAPDSTGSPQAEPTPEETPIVEEEPMPEEVVPEPAPEETPEPQPEPVPEENPLP